MADDIEEKPIEQSPVNEKKQKKRKDKKKKDVDETASPENDAESETKQQQDDEKERKKKKKDKKKKKHEEDVTPEGDGQDNEPKGEPEEGQHREKKKKDKKKKKDEEAPTSTEQQSKDVEPERPRSEIGENDKKKDKKRKKKERKQENATDNSEGIPNDGKAATEQTEIDDKEKQEGNVKEANKKDKKKKKKKEDNVAQESESNDANNEEMTNEQKKNNKEDKDNKKKDKKSKYDENNVKNSTQMTFKNNTKSPVSEEGYQKVLLLAQTFARVSTIARQHNLKISQTNDVLSKVEAVLTQLERTQNTYQFIWKIENFKEHFLAARMGKKMVVYCPKVESHHYGYHIGITLCPNGDGVGLNTHMSLFFFILKGKYDDILPWPFNCSLRFSLMDQNRPKKKKRRDNIVGIFTPNASQSNEPFLGRPTGARNKGLGLPRFAELNTIFENEDKYILDDTIFIKIEVDLNDLETRMDEVSKF